MNNMNIIYEIHCLYNYSLKNILSRIVNVILDILNFKFWEKV